MIKKLTDLLEAKDIKYLLILLFMGLLMSIIEVVGVAAIMPLISMASNPELVYENKYYSYIYNIFNFKDSITFIVYFAILLAVFYIIRALYTIGYIYMLNDFTMIKYRDLVNIIFRNYLNLPYLSFVKKNSSDMLKIIITDAGQVSALTINVLTLLSEFLVIFIMYMLLIIVDIKMTIIITILLGIKIIILNKTVSQKLKAKSVLRALNEEKYYRIINESLLNFKLIKFISEQQKLLNTFFRITKEYANINIYNNTMQIFPRVILETSGFLLLLGAIVYTLVETKSINLLSVISMYALAFYRILPAVTKILTSYNNIMLHSRSLEIVHSAVNDLHTIEGSHFIQFQKFIELKSISFAYGENHQVFNKINLKFNKGDKIAIIGSSGSGKSTLVDLICGIYQPDSGKIIVDEVEIDKSNIVAWRKRIGYIPQSIYLFDGSIRDNITFGRDYNEDKLVKVLQQAKIYDFVMSKGGFDAMVGENGVQLSGGQKQRIGIARALYGDPEILVLDEATSALDTQTESHIMNEIYALSKEKTLMVIAHRLSTIEHCNIKINLNEFHS